MPQNHCKNHRKHLCAAEAYLQSHSPNVHVHPVALLGNCWKEAAAMPGEIYRIFFKRSPKGLLSQLALDFHFCAWFSQSIDSKADL